MNAMTTASTIPVVRTVVCEPAGMLGTAFLRSDEFPGRAARGYLFVDGLRTNVFHPPCSATATGAFTRRLPTQRLLGSLFAGRIVSPERAAKMVRPRSD